MIVLDTVYMVCLPKNRGVIYGAAGGSPAEAWTSFEELELGGTGVDRLDARRRGYRARKVHIVLDKEPADA